MVQIRFVLISLLLSLLANPVLAGEQGDRAAFKAAYARYNLAIEAQDAAAAAIAAGESLELGKNIYSADSPSLNALYLNFGYALADSGQYKKATKPLDEAVEQLEKLYGDTDERLIEPLWALSDAYAKTKRNGRAKRVDRKISSLIKVWNPEDKMALGDANKKIGVQLQRDGQLKLAKKHLEEARQIFEVHVEEPSLRLGEALFWLGKIDVLRHRKSELTANYFQDALQIFEKLLPEDHPYLLTTRGFIFFITPFDERTLVCKSGPTKCNKLANKAPDYFPIAKVQPIYPRQAIARRMEGWVQLEFTVTMEGSVVDPRVIASDGSGLFEASSIKAAKLFKFKPRTVDGVPVDVAGVRNIITFEME